MMKKLMMVPVLVLMAAAVFAQARNPVLGVLAFTGGSGQDGETIADLFSHSRDLSQEFDLLPRTISINSVMREQQFQRSGITDSDTIAQLGEQSNADYVVSGHITSLGRTELLLISIVHVETMQLVAGDYQSFRTIEDVRRLLPEMSKRIIASKRQSGSGSNEAKPLAVLPLDIRDPQVEQEDAEILAQILAIEIANGRKYAVFPRTSKIREAREREVAIQGSSLTSRETIAIGRATNAEYVLDGKIMKLGRMNLFSASILDVETPYKSGEQGLTASIRIFRTA
jgi:TolB-like protein